MPLSHAAGRNVIEHGKFVGILSSKKHRYHDITAVERQHSERLLMCTALHRLTYIKSKRVSSFPSLLHEDILHMCANWLVFSDWRMNLNVLHPNVFPKGQTDHIQIFLPVVEETRQLHKHYNKEETISS